MIVVSVPIVAGVGNTNRERLFNSESNQRFGRNSHFTPTRGDFGASSDSGSHARPNCRPLPAARRGPEDSAKHRAASHELAGPRCARSRPVLCVNPVRTSSNGVTLTIHRYRFHIQD